MTVGLSGFSDGIHPMMINLYPQFTYHDDAKIAGTREGLTLLRDAINAALDTAQKIGKAERVFEVFTSDGEGYQLSVICMDDDDRRFPEPQYGFQFQCGQPEKSKVVPKGCVCNPQEWFDEVITPICGSFQSLSNDEPELCACCQHERGCHCG